MLGLIRKMKNNVRQIKDLGIPGIQGAFLDKLIPDIAGFTD